MLYNNPTPFFYPRTGWQPLHTCTRKAALYHAVNSSGNLFFEITPSIFAGNLSDTTNTVQYGVVVLNNPGYTNINGTGYALSTGGGLTDLTCNRQLAISSTGTMFWGQAIAMSMQVSVTGVSNLNRKGTLNFIEYSDNTYTRLDNSSTNSYNQVNSYMNSRPYTSMIQYPHHAEYELSSSTDQVYNYTWIPNYSHSEYDNYTADYTYFDPTGAVSSVPLTSATADYKKIALYASGLPDTAIFRIDITVAYNCLPRPGFINQYPVQKIRDNTDITPTLIEYGNDNNFLFTSGKSNHTHQFYGGVSDMAINNALSVLTNNPVIRPSLLHLPSGKPMPIM